MVIFPGLGISSCDLRRRAADIGLIFTSDKLQLNM